MLTGAPCREVVGLIVLAILTAAAGQASAGQNSGGQDRHAQTVFDVRDYGATGDGKTLDTSAIAKAIQVASGAGGGTVVFPPGVYLTGTFELLSNVTLEVMAGDGCLLQGFSVTMAVHPDLFRSTATFTECTRWSDLTRTPQIGTKDRSGTRLITMAGGY